MINGILIVFLLIGVAGMIGIGLLNTEDMEEKCTKAVIIRTYFSSLSLSGMINYLANAGTQVEVYIIPKKRIKEVVK
jgi:hypothetical protein